MAAIIAALPAIASGIATLAPLVKPLVLWVENLFGKGTGATKLATVSEAVQVVANKLATAGTIQGLPTIEQITALVQGTVDDLKAKGQLQGPAPVTVTAGAPAKGAPASSTSKSVGALLESLGQLLQGS